MKKVKSQKPRMKVAKDEESVEIKQQDQGIKNRDNGKYIIILR